MGVCRKDTRPFFCLISLFGEELKLFSLLVGVIFNRPNLCTRLIACF